MLRSPKKPALMQAQPTHVDLFVEYYDLLRRWALQFTEHDKDLAEDLLHDTFIHFTLSKPDLSSIQNLDGYLFVMMRNLHLSQLRRATRSPIRSFVVIEYDTADMSFWASDPRDHLRMRDELNAVCQFACIRKEGSKAGSILILRFFHGYYPDEIALVMHTTRGAVNAGLRQARAEAGLYLEEPARLGLVGVKTSPASKITINPLGGDLRLALRSQIFDSRQGICVTVEALEDFYKPESVDAIDRQILAHIVSCQTCIENVNSLLGLPPLASRYPLDTIGKDPGKKGGSGGGAGGTGGGPKMLDSYISRRDAHYYHEPKELCISVNGQLQGLQKIVSGKGELMLILDTSENLGFVEVFSELGLRLLMLNVEPPPSGDGKQSTHIELSGGRTIDASLNFSGAHPALQVSYNDPVLEQAAAEETSDIPLTASPESTAAAKTIPFSKQRSQLTSLFVGWKSWFQPVRLTAAFAGLLIATLLIIKFFPPGTVSAAELLTKSAAAEDVRLANRDRVLHRTFDFEERNANGEQTQRKRIDVWQSSEKGITVRRLYDEQGQLTIGDWRVEGGVQTLYQNGHPPKLRPLPENRVKSVTFDNAWQLSVSAQEFIEILASTEQAVLEERTNDYLITYASNDNKGITKAAIVLSKDDLHAIEQTFTLINNGEARDYRFVETSFEWKPASSVAPAVFEPNVELTGDKAETRPVGGAALEPAATNTNTDTETTNMNAAAPVATLATAALEVEVIEALNNAGAFTGEQIDVSRSGDGKISVTALVETANRKQALINALAGVKNSPAVRIRIETVAEADARVKKQNKATTPNTQPGTVERFDAVEGTNPVYAELRKKFSDQEARRFVSRVLNRSGQARSHALAMKQLSGRFSQADLASLTAAERGRWLALIRGHAERFVNEAETLRRDLQQFFPEAAAGAGGGGAIGSDTELQARARELYDASVAIDRSLNRSLALTAGASGGAPLGSAFWRQFAQAVGMARSLAAAK